MENDSQRRGRPDRTGHQGEHSAASEVLLCVACAAVLSAAFLWFCQRRGYTLYYGDAASHINIARRIADSRAPGYEQIGTVWLPLPHALMAPLVRYDRLWRTGLGGAIPAAAFFVAGAGFLYAAVRRATGSRAAALTAAAVWALNPNLLYLQAAPMTEPIFLGCLAAAVYFAVRLQAAAAGAALLAASLTRYDGWFLIPFFVLYFWTARSWRAAAVAAAVASLGPLYWLAHNYYLYSDALEFYRGPHSALAIYARGASHPGDHDLRTAWLYYRQAIELTLGRPLLWIGAAGVAAAMTRRATRPLVLLALPVPFYILSIHSGGAPIHVPSLFPFTYYNTRYGLAALPACAAAAGVVVALARSSWLRGPAAAMVLAVSLGGWFLRPSVQSWICWKESEVNSRGRRAWTDQAAGFFARAYRPGDGILTAGGDVLAVYQAAGIPLRETLNDASGPAFLPAVLRPDLFLREQWVVAIAGDAVSSRLKTAPALFERVAQFTAHREPVIEIYRKVQ